MPSAWSLIDTNFPAFTGEEKVRDQVSVILNYMFMLSEGLKYQLSNLGSQNFNTTALKNIQIETTADVEEALGQVTEELTGVKNSLSTLLSGVGRLESWQKDAIEQMDALAEALLDLADALADLQESLGQLKSIVRKNEDGSITVGSEGVRLDLIGEIYVNGNLIE